jgi:hypothetical protein
MVMAHPMLEIFEIRGFGNPQAALHQDWIKCDKCPACGRAVEVKSPTGATLKIGAAGTRWPDILSEIDGVLLHERVCTILKQNGATGFRTHPVNIAQIESKKLAAQPVPQYYLIEIKGTVDVDPNEMDDEGGSLCPVCFYRNPRKENPYRWSPKRLVPKLETWDGSDFVKIRNWRCGLKFCSRRFIDLANKHRWTNFAFGYSLPGIGLWEKPSEDGLSYLDSDWFPKLSERVKAKYPDLFLTES